MAEAFVQMARWLAASQEDSSRVANLRANCGRHKQEAD